MRCPIQNCNTKPKNLESHLRRSFDPEHSRLLFNESNRDNWVECKICGLRRSRIDFHLKQHHGYSVEQYKQEFDAEILSKNFMILSTKGGKIRYHDLHGQNNPFYGHKHSQDSRNRISKTILKSNSELEIHFNKGRHHSEETRKKMSESKIGEKNNRFGLPAAEGCTHSIHGYRGDIGHSVRSTFEANFARYLKYENIKYEYEPKSFLITTSKGKKENCWIDFYLVQANKWIELKNYNGRDLTKLAYVRSQYSDLDIEVLYQDSQEWKDIEEKYRLLIPLWETQNRNLRTNPELF